jgi:hypothetical protein
MRGAGGIMKSFVLFLFVASFSFATQASICTVNQDIALGYQDPSEAVNGPASNVRSVNRGAVLELGQTILLPWNTLKIPVVQFRVLRNPIPHGERPSEWDARRGDILWDVKAFVERVCF